LHAFLLFCRWRNMHVHGSAPIHGDDHATNLHTTPLRRTLGGLNIAILVLGLFVGGRMANQRVNECIFVRVSIDGDSQAVLRVRRDRHHVPTPVATTATVLIKNHSVERVVQIRLEGFVRCELVRGGVLRLSLSIEGGAQRRKLSLRAAQPA